MRALTENGMLPIRHVSHRMFVTRDLHVGCSRIMYVTRNIYAWSCSAKYMLPIELMAGVRIVARLNNARPKVLTAVQLLPVVQVSSDYIVLPEKHMSESLPTPTSDQLVLPIRTMTAFPVLPGDLLSGSDRQRIVTRRTLDRCRRVTRITHVRTRQIHVIHVGCIFGHPLFATRMDNV